MSKFQAIWDSISKKNVTKMAYALFSNGEAPVENEDDDIKFFFHKF